MDQQKPEAIVGDIESTRAELGQKLDLLDARVRRALDPRYRLMQRPWKALGAAAAAGFMLGLRRQPAAPAFESSAVRHRAPRTARPMFRDVLVSAVAVLLYEGLRRIVAQVRGSSKDRSKGVPTSAANASWSSGAGAEALGFDSPPIASSTLSNPEIAGVEHVPPYYPPGGAPDGVSLRTNKQA